MEINNHEDVHGDVLHSCDQCDYKSKWKAVIKRHIESVHGDVFHSCDQCDYKSKWKVVIKRHIDSVHGDVRYTRQHGNVISKHI